MCGTGDFAALAVCAGRLAITLAAVAGLVIAYRLFMTNTARNGALAGANGGLDQ